jgi:hypothetical protein
VSPDIYILGKKYSGWEMRYIHTDTHKAVTEVKNIIDAQVLRDFYMRVK